MRGVRSVFIIKYAGVAELADALDLGSSVNRRGGSSPFTRTTDKKLTGFDCKLFSCLFLSGGYFLVIVLIYHTDFISVTFFKKRCFYFYNLLYLVLNLSWADCRNSILMYKMFLFRHLYLFFGYSIIT